MVSKLKSSVWYGHLDFHDVARIVELNLYILLFSFRNTVGGMVRCYLFEWY